MYVQVYLYSVAEVPYNVTVTARNSAGEGAPVEIVDFTEELNCK